MPPDPLSSNMSDVNPHLTQCEPPPYLMGTPTLLKGRIRPCCVIHNYHKSFLFLVNLPLMIRLILSQSI